MAWLTGWNRRKSKIVNGSSSPLADYQIKLIVHKSSGTDTLTDVYLGPNVRDDFGDVRFTSSDEITSVNYWIESLIYGVSAIILVKIPLIPVGPGSTNIYIYYDNPSATTTSNGNTTFDFYDDFSGPAKWTGTVTGNVTVNNKYVISGEGGAYSSQSNSSAVNTTTLLSNIIGSGTFSVNLTIIEDASQYGGGYVHQLIQNNSLGDTVLDAGTYTIWTNKTYSLSGTNVRLKLLAQTWGGSVYTYLCECYGDPDCQWCFDNSGGRPSDCGGCGGAPIYATYWANSSVRIHDVAVRKAISLGPTFGTSGPEESQTGNVSFSSIPPGAEIFIDGMDQLTTTPNTITGLSPGTHTYELILVGYNTATGSFTISSGQTTVVPISNLACPTTIKNIGDILTLKATPIQGVAPYTIQFRKSPAQSMGNDETAATEIISDSRIPGGNNISGVPEGRTITRIYTLDGADLEGATTKSGDTGPSIIFATEIIDSCNPPQSCIKYCKVFVACTALRCDFTVT